MRIIRVEYYSQEERDRERDKLGPAKDDTHVYTDAFRIGEFWLYVYGYWYQENEHAATSAVLDALAVSLERNPRVPGVLSVPVEMAQDAKETPGKGRRAVR